MKRLHYATLSVVAFFLLSSLPLAAQISFESGYFINNDGERINCLIRNEDWSSNPKSFQYKLSEEGEKKLGSIKEIKEFGVGSEVFYRRFTVEIDYSEVMINKGLSRIREPEYRSQTVFLKSIVEGEIKLYAYKESNIERFFYQKAEELPKQLIYKQYLNENSKVRENASFKLQLREVLACSGMNTGSLPLLEYKEVDIVGFYMEYYSCSNQEFRHLKPKKGKGFNRVYVMGLAGVGTVNVDYIIGGVLNTEIGNHNYGFKPQLGVGAGFERVLAQNKGRWSILFDAYYGSYSHEATFIAGRLNNGQDRVVNTAISYAYIEAGVHVRHYFPLESGKALFVNAGPSFSFAFNSEFSSEDFSTFGLDIAPAPTAAVGFGMRMSDRLSVETRTSIPRQLLSNRPARSSRHLWASFILSYQLNK